MLIIIRITTEICSLGLTSRFQRCHQKFPIWFWNSGNADPEPDRHYTALWIFSRWNSLSTPQWRFIIIRP